MIKYIIKRVLWMIPITLGVLFIVFTITHLTPGDPVVSMLGTNYTQEQYDMKEAELGLDKPFMVQFVNYVEGVVTEFDLGTSYQTNRAVRDELFDRFPTTISLGLIGTIITILLGIPFGIISATKQYSALDYGVTTVALFFASMPNFWMALMMIILFSLNLKLFPATGLESWKGWVLPCLALGLSPVATVTRMTRSSMLDVVRQDYIRTARAKGLSEGTIIKKHALKNAMIPIITVVGMQMSTIVAGSVIIENIFAIPGIGSLLMSAINNKNYPVIQGGVLLLSLSVCVMNLLVDILYAFVDPSIRAQYASGSKKKKTASVQQDKEAAANEG